jgi:DNA-binding response OmpR family regulator
MTPTFGPNEVMSSSAAVCLLVVDGTPAELAAAAALRRESIAVEVVRLDEARRCPPPEQEVVLLWAPADPAADLLGQTVAWARRGGALLLGCSPDGSPSDVEKALVAGFDDWVAGRSSLREIVARVRALARRLRQNRAAPPERLGFGRIVLDTSRHEAEIGGRRHLLTPREFALLRALVEARGAVVERNRLLDQAWGPDALEVGERAVDNVVARLRRKLEADDILLTVRGAGYRLAAP